MDILTMSIRLVMASFLGGLIGLEREHQFEEYLAQGVILLRTVLKDDKMTRMFQVEKMRGLEVDNQPRPYNITSGGIEIYPTLTVFK